MGYLTNLLLVSAGLLLVSGSPAQKGYPAHKGYPAPKGYPVGTKDNKEGYSRRRDDHKGNDYAAQGEDYIIDHIGSMIKDLAQPVIDVAFNTAIHGVENFLEEELPKSIDQGMQLALEQVEKELPNLLERVVPGLTDKVKEGIQHVSEQVKKNLPNHKDRDVPVLTDKALELLPFP